MDKIILIVGDSLVTVNMGPVPYSKNRIKKVPRTGDFLIIIKFNSDLHLFTLLAQCRCIRRRAGVE